MLIHSKSTGLPFAGAPAHGTPPWFEPVTRHRATTLSPSAIRSSMVTFRSGNDCMAIPCATFAPAKPGGACGIPLGGAKSSAKYWSSASTSLVFHASSMRRTISLLSSDMCLPFSVRDGLRYARRASDGKARGRGRWDRHRRIERGISATPDYRPTRVDRRGKCA